MARTIADLEQRLSDLETHLRLVESQQEWMLMIIRAYGIEGPWVSPAQAGVVFGLGRDRIMDDVEVAERLRLQGKPSDMQYGIHYRNDQGADAVKGSWKINILEYRSILKIPPDQRRFG